MKLINEFKKDFRYSNKHDKFWWKIYSKMFDMNYMFRSPKELDMKGVDRVIVLSSGDLITIDEKIRRGSYDDFLLEYISDKEENTPGWIEKPLECDFIAYAFEEEETAYFFYWLELSKLWKKVGNAWIGNGKRGEFGFDIVEAKNYKDGKYIYTTISLAIPCQMLLRALKYTAKLSLRS